MDEEISFFDRPEIRAIIRFILMGVLYLALGFGIPDEKRSSALEGVMWDVVFCIGGLLLWTVFFSQFILPVRKLGDRLALFDRMIAYFTGGHGPAIFIENGNIRARQNEREKRGPGVLWLDHASAAILRTATRFTKTIGPGVHFTNRDEYVAATVDLHTLTQSIGPNENEDPFTVSQDNENYQTIQDSSLETRGMTRDGIPIVAPIAITFRIDAKEDTGNSIYGYDEENVRKVITESMIQGVRTDQPVWSPLPAKMAVEIWRGYISRFRLNQLFETPPGKQNTNLQLITGLLSDRMSKDVVEELDEFGSFTGGTVPSLESRQLKEMGIKVLSVNVKRIILPPEIEEKLVNKWTTLWEKRAKKESEQIEQERRVLEEKGQVDAQLEFANIMTSEFQNNLPRNKRHAVYLFTHGTSQSVIRNLGLMKKMSKSDTNTLTDLARWLKDEN